MRIIRTLKRSICIFLAAGFVNTASSEPAKETLNLKLNAPQELNIGGTTVALNGNFVKFGEVSAFSYGSDAGISIPAETLFGAQGAIIFNFRLEKPAKNFLSMRYILTIRGKDRTWIGFYLSSTGTNKPFMNFAFKQTNANTMVKSRKEIEYGKWYKVAATWNGENVFFYIDGELEGELKQPFPAVFTKQSMLNIGTFKDKWIAIQAWNENDCAISEVLAYDKFLSNEDIMTVSGITTRKKVQFVSYLAVPQLATVPAIDGTTDENEWQNASSFPAFIDGNNPEGSLIYPESSVMFTHDTKNLYIGFKIHFPAHVKINKGSEEKNKEVWGTESFEFYIQNEGKLYRFAGNVAGGSCQTCDASAANAPWTYKSTLKMQIDDHEVWQGECAIPFSSMGISKFTDGMSLKFNFCHTWRIFDNTGLTSLAGTVTYGDTEKFPVMKLTSDMPSFKSISINNPADGILKQKTALFSTKDRACKYSITLANNAGSSAELFSENVKLEANKKTELDIDRKIESSAYNTLLFKLTDAKTSEVIMEQPVPFKLSENYIDVRPVFGSSKIIITPRTAILKSKTNADKFTFTLSSPSGKNIYECIVSDDKPIEVPFNKENEKGTYKTALSISAKAPLSSKEFFYPGKGEWDVPDTEETRILPLFEPMKCSDGKSGISMSMYGRLYVWEKSLLPVKINSKGEDLLSAPAQILIDGKPVENISMKLGKTAAHRCEFTTSASSQEYSMKGSSWVEYDGTIWNKVTLTAEKTLKSVTFHMEMPEDQAKFLHAAGAGFGGSGAVLAPVSPMQLNFYPMVWLGGYERGLTWFAEGMSTWNTSDKKPVKISTANGRTIFEVVFADSLPKGKKLELEFGLVATPVKALPANYPLNTFAWQYPVKYNFPAPKAPTSYVSISIGGDLTSVFDLPSQAEIRKQLLDNIKTVHENHGRIIPYIISNCLSDESMDVAANKFEWQTTPSLLLPYTRGNSKYNTFRCCPASDESKYYVWKVKKLLAETEIDGIYFDFGCAEICNNHLHGCNNRFPILAMRDFYRKIAWALYDSGRKDCIIVAHNSQALQVPVLNFVSHLLDGENFRQASSGTFHFGKDIQDTLSLSDFASEFSSLPWGITNSVYLPIDKLLPQFGGDKEPDQEIYKFRMTKAALAGTLPFNTIISLMRPHFGLIDKVVRIYDDFKVPTAEFLPFWRNQEMVKVINGKDIYVSLYRNKTTSEILAVVSHISKEHTDQEVVLELNPGKLGLKKFISAEEKLTAADPDYQRLAQEKLIYRIAHKTGDFGVNFKGLENNRITLGLKHHSFAIIKITGAE